MRNSFIIALLLAGVNSMAMGNDNPCDTDKNCFKAARKAVKAAILFPGCREEAEELALAIEWRSVYTLESDLETLEECFLQQGTTKKKKAMAK